MYKWVRAGGGRGRGMGAGFGGQGAGFGGQGEGGEDHGPRTGVREGVFGVGVGGSVWVLGVECGGNGEIAMVGVGLIGQKQGFCTS